MLHFLCICKLEQQRSESTRVGRYDEYIGNRDMDESNREYFYQAIFPAIISSFILQFLILLLSKIELLKCCQIILLYSAVNSAQNAIQFGPPKDEIAAELDCSQQQQHSCTECHKQADTQGRTETTIRPWRCRPEQNASEIHHMGNF